MRYLMLFSLVLINFTIKAQTVLSIEDAVSTALANNFDIRIAQNDALLAKTNNTAGNAGMLPDISATGSGNYALNNVHQNLSNGTTNNYPSMSTQSITIGTALNWTLFDGGKMMVTKKKLNEIEALGGIQLKDQVLQTIYEVTSAYYDVVRQKQQLNSINEAINYNQERVKISETAFNNGSALKTDWLQAKIDLNVYLENAIAQQLTIVNAKRQLNLLLGKDAGAEFEVSDSITLTYSPEQDELLQNLDSANTTIQYFKKQLDISQLSLKEHNRSRLPVLKFQAGYYGSFTDNSDGSILKNSSMGPQFGGTLSIPLYSSGENQRKISGAKIGLETASYQLDYIKLEMNTTLKNALDNFNQQKKLLQIEKDNHELAKENLEISLHRLKQGQTTSLEVHQAQESYVQSGTRLTNFMYNLKMAETKLRQLISTL